MKHLLLLLTLAFSLPAHATLISYSFGGSVTSVNDHGTGLLDSAVVTGTAVSGAFTFDDAVVPSLLSGGLAVYQQPTTLGASFDLSVGNYALSVLGGYYDIQVENDLGASLNNDKLSIESGVGPISFSNASDVFSLVGFSLDLRDFGDGDALSDVALPSAIDLSTFGGANTMLLTFNDGQGGSVDINANIRSMMPVSVPEPETLSLSGFGLVGIGLARRRKRSERHSFGVCLSPPCAALFLHGNV